MDGILAVVMTFLVWNISVPQIWSHSVDIVGTELLKKLFELWPKILSYASYAKKLLSLLSVIRSLCLHCKAQALLLSFTPLYTYKMTICIILGCECTRTWQ
jgi:uncharacterized membrane protein